MSRIESKNGKITATNVNANGIIGVIYANQELEKIIVKKMSGDSISIDIYEGTPANYLAKSIAITGSGSTTIHVNYGKDEMFFINIQAASWITTVLKVTSIINELN